MVRPFADREIEDKLRSLATSWCAAHNIQPLIDALWALDRADDASLPVRLTCRHKRNVGITFRNWEYTFPAIAGHLRPA
jgi:hypothetical protein